MSTQHGLVPGVVSNMGIPPNEFYLDPNLSNDWENWAIFTRAEVERCTAILYYTWGAITNAIKATESADQMLPNSGLKLKNLKLSCNSSTSNITVISSHWRRIRILNEADAKSAETGGKPVEMR